MHGSHTSGRQSTVHAVLPVAAFDAATLSVLASDGGGVIVAANLPAAALRQRGRTWRYASRGNGIARVTIKPEPHGGLAITLATRRAWPPPRADEDASSTIVQVSLDGRCYSGAATSVR